MDLRFPGQAARALGISVNTLKALARRDPAFPAVLRLTPKVQRVRKEDLEEYAEGKRVRLAITPGEAKS